MLTLNSSNRQFEFSTKQICFSDCNTELHLQQENAFFQQACGLGVVCEGKVGPLLCYQETGQMLVALSIQESGGHRMGKTRLISWRSSMWGMQRGFSLGRHVGKLHSLSTPTSRLHLTYYGTKASGPLPLILIYVIVGMQWLEITLMRYISTCCCIKIYKAC